jgi:hypothetical protein
VASVTFARLHQCDVVPLSQARTTADGAAARVASIVEHRSESAFVLLLQLADRHFSDPGFEDALAVSLYEGPTLIELWRPGAPTSVGVLALTWKRL